jgi:GNAT superfamily N-acetyltransferase
VTGRLGLRQDGLVQALKIEPLRPTAENDALVVGELTELVNTVYEAAEGDLWVAGTLRTTEADLAGDVRAGRIAVATVGDAIAGCVRIQRLDDATGEFGMLAADPARRGLGIGRELVRFAERTSAEAGCRVMQLELLVPRGWTHPAKKFLAEWYDRLGYRVTHRTAVADTLPELAPSLATPCDFLIYHKDLT